MHLEDFPQRTRPDAPHRHHRARATASMIAALAAGCAFLGISFLAVTTTKPWEAPGVSILILVSLVVWVTGLWWRWDSPDRRLLNDERERRGY